MQKKLKVGAVSYMNTKPLVWGLEEQNDSIELFFDVPSKLCKKFEQGLLDVALLPAIRYLGMENWCVIPEISIAAQGKVDSVNLYVKKSCKEISEVALDTSSRTSRALTEIILKKKYGLKPKFIDWVNGINLEKSNADAILLIGDDAMRINNSDYKILDLAEEWYDLTNLPFVFAFWVTKRDTDLNGFDKILLKTKENGLNAIDKISEIESKRLGFSKDLCQKYLSKSIRYDLGENEIKGVKQFYEFAIETGVVNSDSKTTTLNNHIEFYKE